MLFTATLLVVICHILRTALLGKQTQFEQNPESEDITHRGRKKKVCFGLTPHHLMLEIKDKPPRKQFSKEFFNIFARQIIQSKQLGFLLPCYITFSALEGLTQNTC